MAVAPKFDRAAWERAAMAEVDARVGFIEEQIVEAVLGGLEYLGNESPIWTGWYVENHHIVLDRGSVDLSPEPDDEERMRGEGWRAVDVGDLLDREDAVARDFRLGGFIGIANAVPYANEIELNGTKTTPEGMYYHGAHLKVLADLSRRLR